MSLLDYVRASAIVAWSDHKSSSRRHRAQQVLRWLRWRSER